MGPKSEPGPADGTRAGLREFSEISQRQTPPRDVEPNGAALLEKLKVGWRPLFAPGKGGAHEAHFLRRQTRTHQR